MFSIRVVCLNAYGVCFLLSALAHALYMDVEVRYSLFSPTTYSLAWCLRPFRLFPFWAQWILFLHSKWTIMLWIPPMYFKPISFYSLILSYLLVYSIWQLSVLLTGLHTLSPLALPSRMYTHLVLFTFRVWKVQFLWPIFPSFSSSSIELALSLLFRLLSSISHLSVLFQSCCDISLYITRMLS